MRWKYLEFQKTEVLGTCFQVPEDRKKMADYESPSMPVLTRATPHPNLPSCLNTSLLLGYLDCGEYVSSLLLEPYRALHPHQPLIHFLQGLPP